MRVRVPPPAYADLQGKRPLRADLRGELGGLSRPLGDILVTNSAPQNGPRRTQRHQTGCRSTTSRGLSSRCLYLPAYPVKPLDRCGQPSPAGRGVPTVSRQIDSRSGPHLPKISRRLLALARGGRPGVLDQPKPLATVGLLSTWPLRVCHGPPVRLRCYALAATEGRGNDRQGNAHQGRGSRKGPQPRGIRSHLHSPRYQA
jgi:hypothetical protein